MFLPLSIISVYPAVTDELPWFATKKSRFLQNLDYFWNHHWSRMDNIKLVVCGSAASWMINNLIRSKGGLHNRTTARIVLYPFNLYETKKFPNIIKDLSPILMPSFWACQECQLPEKNQQFLYRSLIFKTKASYRGEVRGIQKLLILDPADFAAG